MTYIILAGPQAAGKSTTINNLKRALNGRIHVFQENRQIVGRKHLSRKTIFKTQRQEEEIIEQDFQRLEEIAGREDEIFVDETCLFSLAHASLRGVDPGKYFPEYIFQLRSLNPQIVFLDAPPEVSWQRKKPFRN